MLGWGWTWAGAAASRAGSVGVLGVAVSVVAAPCPVLARLASEPAVVAVPETLPVTTPPATVRAPLGPQGVESWGSTEQEGHGRRIAPPGPPPPTGAGLLVAGGTTMGLGLLGMLGGGLLLRSANEPEPMETLPSCPWHSTSDEPCDSSGLDSSLRAAGRALGGFFLVVLSIAPTVGGGVMLAIGGVRHHRHRQYSRGRPVWQPRVQRTLHGTWTAGLTLRF